MATSSFKSTTKRSSIGANDAASSNRRSRSLSRAPSPEEVPPPRRSGRFVNTIRGSGFPEISLDLDLNLHDNQLNGDRSRPAARRRPGIISPSSAAATAAQRRGRSVSRPHSRRVVHEDDDGVGDCSSKGSKKTSTSYSSSTSGARRRSVSVSRYQFSDSESEEHSHKYSHHANVKSFGSWNYRKPSMQKPVTPNHQRVLKRSLSQKELSKSFDGYSSHSSALTDDEVRDTRPIKNGIERTIREVYSQKKTEHPTGDGVETGLYEVMRQELRHAVEDIRTEIEQGIMNVNHSVANGDSLQSNNSDVLQAVSMIRKNYTAKLEQSEKRKQDLLAEIVAEEQRGQELSKIVKELLPDPKNTAVQEKSFHGRKTNDRSWMSKCLTEDAEKYFDDFLSNVEDTDISSFDGERSDASSTIGVKKARDLVVPFGERGSLPVEMDGVVLPWLQWETSNDGSPLLCKSKAGVPLLPEGSSSSQGESTSTYKYNGSRSHPSSSLEGGSRRVDGEYFLHTEPSEEIVFEAWRQRQGITSGALILCSSSSRRSWLEL